MPDLDEGKQISRSMNVREAMGLLHRQGQLDLDHWLCQLCGYPNHPKSRMCRGYVDVRYPGWRGEPNLPQLWFEESQ